MASIGDCRPFQATGSPHSTPDTGFPTLLPLHEQILQVDTESTHVAPSLLDLPPELLQDIIHELIKDVAISKAHFSAEIEADAFARQDRQAVAKIYRDGRMPRPFWTQWIRKHICYKVQHLPTNTAFIGTVFLLRIRDMTESVAKERKLEEEEKNWVRDLMCDLVQWRLHPTVLAQLLRLSRKSYFMFLRPKDVIQYIASALTLEMKLSVAAHFGDVELVKSLLPHVDFSEYRNKDHVMFGDPLGNAAIQGHNHIILVVVEWVRSGTPQFVQVCNQFQSSYMRNSIRSSRNRTSCNFNEALADAMHFCDEATMEDLLWLHRICTKKLHQKDYIQWLESAIDAEDPRMLELVLEVNPDTTYQRVDLPYPLFEYPRKYAFTLACESHHPELVKTFIDLAQISPNELWESVNSAGEVTSCECALDIAAESGSEEVIAVLLDAGASIDGLGMPARATQEQSSTGVRQKTT
ncbi:hypothetical protein PMIN06_001391 [Paraphaeosphaeria minitans]